MLSRSAWAGSQRYGAAVWSGDIRSTFDTLSRQVRAALNIGMSGIPWWTTDIGGYFDGHNDDPEFRELSTLITPNTQLTFNQSFAGFNSALFARCSDFMASDFHLKTQRSVASALVPSKVRSFCLI